MTRRTVENKERQKNSFSEEQLENLDLSINKQPFRCVLKKRCSENMQQIYRRTSRATLLKSHLGMGVLL